MTFSQWIRGHGFVLLFLATGIILAVLAEISIIHESNSSCVPYPDTDCGAMVMYFLLGPAEGIVVAFAFFGRWLDRRRVAIPPRPDGQ